MTVPPGPSSALRWQVVIWRDGDDLWKDPEVLLEKFKKTNCCYKCFAEHEGEKSGRRHYHCYLRFKTGRERAQMVKTFGQNVRNMKGDDYDNAKYISHDGKLTSFWEEGTKKKYSEQSTAIVVDELLKSGQSILDIITEHVELRGYIGQNRWVLQQVERAYTAKRTRAEYEAPAQLYDWQQHVKDSVEGDPHPRHILWYLDTEGDCGKSEIEAYLWAKYPEAISWQPTGADRDCSLQLLRTSNGKPPKLIVVDFEGGEARNICWAALERAKNGRCITNKYEGGEYRGKRPHIVVFSNENPTGSPLTGNRLRIMKIVDKKVVEETVV